MLRTLFSVCAALNSSNKSVIFQLFARLPLGIWFVWGPTCRHEAARCTKNSHLLGVEEGEEEALQKGQTQILKPVQRSREGAKTRTLSSSQENIEEQPVSSSTNQQAAPAGSLPWSGADHLITRCAAKAGSQRPLPGEPRDGWILE